jgi:hypothetical protein
MTEDSEENHGEPNNWEPVEEPAEDGTTDLERRERELEERERELERREQEILERREENVEKREKLDEREEQLEGLRQRQEERTEELESREAELDEREEEIDTKLAALEEYAGKGRTFTRRPRIAGGLLLWVVAAASALFAVATFLYAGPEGYYIVESTTAMVLAAFFALVAILEVVGGYMAYTGRRWSIAVLAGILGIVVLLPVGVTATIMITVGESQFD